MKQPDHNGARVGAAVVALSLVVAVVLATAPNWWPSRISTGDPSLSSGSGEAAGGAETPLASVDQYSMRRATNVAHEPSAAVLPPSEGGPIPFVDDDGRDLTWTEAKLEMRRDFVVNDSTRESVTQAIMGFNFKVGDKWETETARIDFGDLDSIDWAAVAARIGAKGTLSEIQLEDLRFVAGEYHNMLTECRDVAVQELEQSFLQYWDHDMGYRYRIREQDKPPAGFFARTHGSYRKIYISSAGGWGQAVRFDSAEFPLLEAHFTEARRVHFECYDIIKALVL